MKNVTQNLAALIKVKSIVTFAVISCLCILVVRQNTEVTSEMFAAVVSSVITYFFTKNTNVPASVSTDQKE